MENTSFFLMAIGHYGADDIALQVGLRSKDPQKQLLEFEALKGAVDQFHEQLKKNAEESAARVVLARTVPANGATHALPPKPFPKGGHLT